MGLRIKQDDVGFASYLMLGMLPFSESNKVTWILLPLWMDKFLLPIKVELK